MAEWSKDPCDCGQAGELLNITVTHMFYRCVKGHMWSVRRGSALAPPPPATQLQPVEPESQGDVFHDPPPLHANDPSLEEMRARARLPIETCRSCGGSTKVYRSPLGVTVRVLVWMLTNSERGDYIHVPSAPAGWLAGGGDYAKLRYWGLIEQHPRQPSSDKRASGLWRLTDLGRRFALHQASVSSHCFWRHPGSVLGFESQQIDIVEALGKHFNYRELMSGRG